MMISIVLLLLGLIIPSHSFLDGRQPESFPKNPPINVPNKDQRIMFPSTPRNDNLILAPSPEKRGLGCDTAVVLFPGCMLRPQQYEAMARCIQDQSKGTVWIHVPSQVHGFANPFNLGNSVRSALKDLQELGFPGTSTFVAGHSLGAAFLPSVLANMGADQVEGFIRLGCVASRDSEHHAAVPQLTLCGDLDGLVRASRVAEEYFHHVESRGNTKSDKLHHPVVLVEGMNHFGFVEGEPTFMHEFRDLESEITTEEAVLSTASAIAEFLDFHRQGNEAASRRLLAKVDGTYEYIRPLLEAMLLEGSFHIESPCHLVENCLSKSCTAGSPWVEKVQRELSPVEGDYRSINDEFRQSWWINPFADPPFHHPRMKTTEENKLKAETVSEPVYEKPDFFFDTGLFSNAALEIRSKFTSPQAILKSQGIDAECDVNDGACSQANGNTIQWALEHAPERVRRRYQSRGVQLSAGRDIKRRSGRSWSWARVSLT